LRIRDGAAEEAVVLLAHTLQSESQIAEETTRQAQHACPTEKMEMSHMFCTLLEAAQTLNASEDQVKDLLERGLLHEFRAGPHCLVKEADVSALARQQRQRRESSSPIPAPQTPPARAEAQKVRTEDDRRLLSSHLPTFSPAGPDAQPGPQDGERGRLHHKRHAPGRPRTPYTQGRAAYPQWAPETGPRRPDRRRPEGLSVRQWFWMGLVQDSPVAIALLAGLALALVSALVAGLCYLARVS